ncbi:Anaphase-promoting complex subunit 2 [Kickxella alabastrina]|uniref:Anaphase-promoting complex subunit 2 n=1 Tax=Kickxella alabastrina TaxID=61397 RepID=A0ACC1IB21_9FUNG|nr:Anaphase-promoting complex subunit 2 [Kickxella alabastrina]
MNTYNLCGTLSPQALHTLAHEITSARKCCSQGIAALASQYCQRLERDVADMPGNPEISDLVGFRRFADFLQGIHVLHEEFKHRVDGEKSDLADSAWRALVFGVFDDRVQAWLEEWIYAATSCLLTTAEDNSNNQQQKQTDGLGISGPISGLFGSPDDARLFNEVLEQGCQLLTAIHALEYVKCAVNSGVGRAIRALVQRQAGQWTAPALDRLTSIVNQSASVLCAHLPNDALRATHTATLRAHFSQLRVSELFSIITDYPASLPAIIDLRASQPPLGEMAHSLRASTQRRLLHQAATTADILTQYISTIRVLRLLDPTSTALEIVARPLRSYLRSRPDTVACVVQDMVAEHSELFEDLASADTAAAANAESTHGFNEDGLPYDQDYALPWAPLPREAQATYRTAQRRDADVLGLLVSIYDSPSLFVKEFEAHLQRRLLDAADYETSREVRQVEMMKMRFGPLDRCEVMLKDVADSKRLNAHCAQALQRWAAAPMHALVVSRQFWPSAAAPTPLFSLPGEMAEICDKYAGMYESLRPARKLEWVISQGHVTLDVELGDRALKVTVGPDKAALLMAFQATPRMTAAEAAAAIECTEEFVFPLVRFWQAQGVLRESAGAFEVAETIQEEAWDAESESDSEHVDPAGDKQKAEAMQMHANYITGMLTSIGPLPLDRIHGMLAMFLPGDTTTLDELRDLLALMVRNDRLELVGGTYKLK